MVATPHDVLFLSVHHSGSLSSLWVLIYGYCYYSIFLIFLFNFVWIVYFSVLNWNKRYWKKNSAKGLRYSSYFIAFKQLSWKRNRKPPAMRVGNKSYTKMPLSGTIRVFRSIVRERSRCMANQTNSLAQGTCACTSPKGCVSTISYLSRSTGGKRYTSSTGQTYRKSLGHYVSTRG